MDDQLQNMLRSLIQSGWQSNPAMHKIINDYAKYHATLVIAGGLFTLILISLSVVFWAKFKEISNPDKFFKFLFKKKVYFSFGLLSSIVALFMVLVVAANATNAFNPLYGFSLLVDSLTPSTYSTPLRHAYSDWIQSGSSTPPILIRQHIHQRVMFHTTKAVVCSILMIIFTALSIRLWSFLIKRRNASKKKWRPKEKTFLAAGIATVVLSLLMMIIVVANLQGAVAPITLTLLFS